MELYEALSARRKLIKISFDELSARTAIPVSTLKKVFTGVTANPPFETVRSIAYAMGITTDDLSNTMRYSPTHQLSPAALSIAQKYDQLDSHGQEIVSAVTELEVRRCARSLDDLSARVDAAISASAKAE